MGTKIIFQGIIFLSLFLTEAGAQEYDFHYSDLSKKIYQQIIDLKLDSARIGVQRMTAEEPNNLARLHLENYIDFFQIFICEEEEQFKSLEKNKQKRLDLLDEHLAEGNPYKRFAKAEILLQWALARSKFDQLFKAGKEVLSAYKLLEKNERAHPDFIYNKKSLSIIHSLIATVTIPGLFKKVLGINGSIDQGLSEINQVIDYSDREEFIFYSEADAILAFILFYQANRKDEAVDFLLDSRLEPSTSLLSTFLVSKLLQRSGRNDQASHYLSNRPSTEDYSTFHYLTYMEGLCELRRLDPEAEDKIAAFIAAFTGKHYIKEAYQKRAWCRLVFHDDIPGYKLYMSKVKSEGDDLIDGDKQALKEAESQNIPDPLLLRVRLLYDGGYYQRAYVLLTKNAYRYHQSGKYSLEFNYRIARVCQALRNYPDAIKYFSSTVNTGYQSDSYFACNAALQLGFIYETLGETKRAEKYFDTCLSLRPKTYKNSLHQKAKSGLQRIKS